MTHTTVSTTAVRRTSSTLGATALLGLALAAPALAGPTAGPGPVAPEPVATYPHAHPARHGIKHDDSSANAAESRLLAPKPLGPPSYNTWPHGTGSVPVTPAGATRVTARVLGDSSVQYLQIGLGAVGGALLTAAAAGAVATRNRHQGLPA